MRDAIGFIDTATFRADPAGMALVNQDQGNTHLLGPVADGLAKLIKRAVALLAYLRAANRSLANTTQCFKSSRFASVLRCLNKPRADDMIGVLQEARLVCRKLLESVYSGFGLFLLKITAAMRKAAPVSVYLRPAEILPIRIRGNIHDPRVRAQNALNVNRFWRFHCTGSEQIELALDVTQVTGPALTTQQFELSCAGREGDPLMTVHRPNRNFMPFEMGPANPLIRGHRAMRVERAFGFAVDLPAIGNFRNAAHHDLRGQREPIRHLSISQLVQTGQAKSLLFPGLIQNIVAGHIVTSPVLRSAPVSVGCARSLI